MKTIEQLIGQMMIIGWKDRDINGLLNAVCTYNFSNVILFERNFSSASDLSSACKLIQEASLRYAGGPAFICLNQEGGAHSALIEGVTPTPCNMAVAAASSRIRSGAASLGRIIGMELKSLGVNCNLAPVVDINTNPYNPNIATRSYSDNPPLVSSLASDYAIQLQEQGVMGCYKHFLGHGDIDTDARLDLPRVKKTLVELETCELIPFSAARISDAIMMSHILYTAIDDRYPASLSKIIQTEFLRKKMHFEGLIISDCFEMGALSRAFFPTDAAVFAVNAGTNLVMVSNTLDMQVEIRNAIIAAAQAGRIPMDVILSSNARIARMKEKYCRPPAQTEIDFKKNRAISEKISEKSITVVSGRPFMIRPEDTICIGVCNTVMDNDLSAQIDEAKFLAEDVNVAAAIGGKFNIPYESIHPKRFDIGSLQKFAKDKKVILCLADSHLTLIQRILYNALEQDKRPMILISMRTPFDILNQYRPECHIVAYEYTALSIRSILRVLAGEEAVGICPVKLEHAPRRHRQDNAKSFLAENILDYIKENFQKKLTLESVAEEFYISGGHLCKVVKNKLNKNFAGLVNEIRIDKAKTMLRDTTLRIYDISVGCGFSDINYFTKTFRRYAGCPPTYYRSHPEEHWKSPGSKSLPDMEGGSFFESGEEI